MHARSIGLAAAALASTFACVATAQAAGGSNIESAPQVSPGVQTFGTTGTGRYQCAAADYWNLSLAAGDEATIDWMSVTDSDGGDYANELSVYPAGTTDFSINNVERMHEFSIGDNDRAESIFSANTTGSYPLIFWRASGRCSSPGGPYSFTVTVKHSVVLFLGSVKKLDRRSGTISVGVHTPEGQPITDPGLRVSLRGSWPGHKASELAGGSPSGGIVSLSVKLPKSTRGKKVSIRAISAGAGYRSAHSSLRTVRVKRR
jgi:hypothetical protein